MDAKIFAIKTKLQLMEKEGTESLGLIGSNGAGTKLSTKKRYEPYHRNKPSWGEYLSSAQ